VCAVQLPGHDSRMREKPCTDLMVLIDGLMQGLAGEITTNYAFFGHSMGALIAYEFVRRIHRERRQTPVHLFVSARRAPHLPLTEGPYHKLPDSAFVDVLVNRYNGIPQAILGEPDLMQLFLPILRADFTLLETYNHIPGEPLSEPITVFGGLEDRIVSQADLSAWKQLTRGAVDVHMMSGGHFFLQSAPEPMLRIMAAALRDTAREG